MLGFTQILARSSEIGTRKLSQPTLRTHFRGLQNLLKAYKSVWLLNFSILGNPIEDYLHAKHQRGSSERIVSAIEILKVYSSIRQPSIKAPAGRQVNYVWGISTELKRMLSCCLLAFSIEA